MVGARLFPELRRPHRANASVTWACMTAKHDLRFIAVTSSACWSAHRANGDFAEGAHATPRRHRADRRRHGVAAAHRACAKLSVADGHAGGRVSTGRHG